MCTRKLHFESLIPLYRGTLGSFWNYQCWIAISVGLHLSFSLKWEPAAPNPAILDQGKGGEQ